MPSSTPLKYVLDKLRVPTFIRGYVLVRSILKKKNISLSYLGLIKNYKVFNTIKVSFDKPRSFRPLYANIRTEKRKYFRVQCNKKI